MSQGVLPQDGPYAGNLRALLHQGDCIAMIDGKIGVRGHCDSSSMLKGSYRDQDDGQNEKPRERETPNHGVDSIDPHAADRAAFDHLMPPVQSALDLLFESLRFARELGKDPWQFSVEWPEFHRIGVTGNDVRWLIHRGLVRHARETTRCRDEQRRFIPCLNLGLTETTCFILTHKGERLARLHHHRCVIAEAKTDQNTVMTMAMPPGSPRTVVPAGQITPTWDRDRRQLRLGSAIVKEFKVPAMNQEIILAVFEEERWPPKIDDPLPRKPEIDPQRRLHDTINSLNRRQRRHLVHFGADGLGCGIRWELVVQE